MTQTFSLPRFWQATHIALKDARDPMLVHRGVDAKLMHMYDDNLPNI